jgi:hemerythrin-like domain-containing protein
MKPIGPLMREHRLIEKMLAVVGYEVAQIRRLQKVDPVFVDTAVDFIRTYADRTHHGKEEDILFRDLAKKSMSAEHKRIVDELIEEHQYARKTVGRLVTAKDRYLRGEQTLPEIVDCLEELADFYPRHIEKEDKHFFYPILDYFSAAEQDAMLNEFWEFDRKMIHEKYTKLVERLTVAEGPRESV